MYDHTQTQTIAETMHTDVLRILKQHVGAHQAIKASEIAKRLDRKDDRIIRETIRQLRREGHLILSSITPPYGYFIAATEDEWFEFRDRNLRPRALDILETARAMGEAAERRYGSTAGIDLLQPQQLDLGL